jgi:hypothetical protein
MTHTINEVFNEVYMMRTNLFMGDPGQVREGLVPATQREVTALGSRLAGVEQLTQETHALLDAVNKETLGRIEGEIQAQGTLLAAVNEVTLGRIETDGKSVVAVLPVIRQDIAGVLNRIEQLDQDLRQRFLELHSKIDGVKQDIANLK